MPSKQALKISRSELRPRWLNPKAALLHNQLMTEPSPTCACPLLPWQLTMLENMYPRQVLEFAMSGSGANSNLGSLAYEHEDVSLARGGKGTWG